MTPRALVDCSNLHSGGAVQVAASFVDEVSFLINDNEVVSKYPWLKNTSIFISSEVGASLGRNVSHLPNIQVVDHGPKSLTRWLRRPSGGPYDAAFVVFGPHYGRKPATKTLLGYADVTSLYPTPHGLRHRSLARKYRSKLRGSISRRLLRQHDHIVVETQAIADRVSSIPGLSADDISVVPNAYNAIFEHPELWGEKLHLGPGGLKNSSQTTFGYVTRAYPHKNIDFIGPYIETLNQLGHSAICLLTLRQTEWDSLSSLTKRHCINVGPLTMAQVPRFYEECTAALFPSLLEAFSVAPLEAMRMGLPIVASDRDFVRTTCKDVPIYINPNNPEESAQETLRVFNSSILQRKIESGVALAQQMPNPRERALSYIEILHDLLEA